MGQSNLPLRIRLDKTTKAGEFLKTRNCNLNCFWCHGDYFRHKVGVKALNNDKFIDVVVKVLTASSRPTAEIKISGQGEPCLSGKKELCDLIRGLRSFPKISTIKLVTNGILLDEMVQDLFNSGLDGANISIHSLKPQRYQKIAGKDKLAQAIRGVRAARKAGLKVKLNVIYCRFNEDEIWDFVNFAGKEKVEIKFFDLLHTISPCRDLYLPPDRLCKQLESKAASKKVFEEPYVFYEYHFDNGAIIQVKNCRINKCPQKRCKYRQKCLEGCRLSVRISAEGILHPCGVRIDNIIPLTSRSTGIAQIKKALLSGGKN
jgi:molybdenum cofactor biosynthesis enzyme MoaA